MKNVYLFIIAMFGTVLTSFSQISSTTLGGNWSDPLTWNGGIVPGPTDDVIISDAAIVIIDQDVSIQSLTVGQGASGILEYEPLNARSVTVAGNVVVGAGAIFRSAVTGNITTHVLSTGGDLTNNGVLDFSTNGNTAGAGIIFTGAANTNFNGTGTTTDVSAITVNKGTSAASIVELNTNAFSFRGATSTPGFTQAFLNIINGTFKLSGTFTGDNGVFVGTGTFIIPATGGFWLNNPNFTVNGRAGDLEVDGTLTVDAGTLNVGTNPNNRLLYLTGTIININGGAVNVASRLTAITTFGINYTQTGGVFTVNTIGNTSGTRASFDIEDFTDGSSFTMSGGTIVIQNPNSSGSGNRDYFNQAETVNITGGTLQIGNAATAPTQTFFVSGFAPSFVINNSTGGRTVQLLNDLQVYGNTTINAGATLNLNNGAGTGRIFTQRGATLTNLGTLNGTLPGSAINFSGTTAQTYGGDGTLTVPLQSLVMSNSAGLTITNTVATDIIAFSLSMFAGDITTGVSTLTVGTSPTNPGVFTYTAGTVIGKFKRWFDAVVSARNFPVGVPGSTRTVNILFTTAPAVGGTLTAEWISAYGGTNGLPLTEAGYPDITDVASDGYWTVTAADGLTGGVYTGTFTATNVVTVTDFTQLVLVKRADAVSPWVLDGTHQPTTGSNTTPVLSRTGMVGFSDFAIGGSPTSLPLTIEYFKGTKRSNGNLLDWKVTCTNSPTATMTLERSTDGRRFTTINNITATALRCLQPFNYNDGAPAAGVNYYRIKLTDASGKFTYSNIIALLNKETGFDIVKVLPNPVSNTAIISIAGAKNSKMEIVISDVAGRRVSGGTVSIVAGSNEVMLDLSKLPAGTYQITGYSEGQTKTLRFIKN